MALGYFSNYFSSTHWSKWWLHGKEWMLLNCGVGKDS